MSLKHFENSVTNARGNRKLNVAGVFATYSSPNYTPVAAYPGQLAVRGDLYPSQAYAGQNNPNTWYMVAADNTTTLDELFVCYPDVASFGQKGSDYYNLGVETLGVPQPEGEATRFQKVELGDMLTFGDGWFASTPTSSNKYCAINASGLLNPSSTKPQSGMYFEILETVNFTEGAYAGGTGYYGIIRTV